MSNTSPEQSRQTQFGRGAAANDSAVDADNEAVPAADTEQPANNRRKPHMRSRMARGGMVRFFNFLMTLAVLGAIGFFVAVWYSKTEFVARGPLSAATTFTVPKGASFNSIVPGLEAKRIIKPQGPLRVFVRGVQAAGKASELKAGEFAFEPGMSMQDVMLQLTDGRSIEYPLTLPEGLTSYQIMERSHLPAIPLHLTD